MGNNLIEESLRSNKRRSKDCPAQTPQKRQLKEPICSNQNCQNKSNSNTFVTDLTNVNRKEGGPEQNSNSEESSSWLSWFGF